MLWHPWLDHPELSHLILPRTPPDMTASEGGQASPSLLLFCIRTHKSRLTLSGEHKRYICKIKSRINLNETFCVLEVTTFTVHTGTQASVLWGLCKQIIVNTMRLWAALWRWPIAGGRGPAGGPGLQRQRLPAMLTPIRQGAPPTPGSTREVGDSFSRCVVAPWGRGGDRFGAAALEQISDAFQSKLAWMGSQRVAPADTEWMEIKGCPGVYHVPPTPRPPPPFHRRSHLAVWVWQATIQADNSVTDRWMDGWKDGWTDGRMEGWPGSCWENVPVRAWM